jgi:hypothetical protein
MPSVRFPVNEQAAHKPLKRACHPPLWYSRHQARTSTGVPVATRS